MAESIWPLESWTLCVSLRMHFLSQRNQLVKMFRRRSQNLAHITALCVAGANAICPIGESDISINAEFNDNFGSPIKPWT
jgi:hypothetical protein